MCLTQSFWHSENKIMQCSFFNSFKKKNPVSCYKSMEFWFLFASLYFSFPSPTALYFGLLIRCFFKLNFLFQPHSPCILAHLYHLQSLCYLRSQQSLKMVHGQTILVPMWIKSHFFLWIFRNLKILFSCSLPMPPITQSTCSELWRKFRNVCL